MCTEVPKKYSVTACLGLKAFWLYQGQLRPLLVRQVSVHPTELYVTMATFFFFKKEKTVTLCIEQILQTCPGLFLSDGNVEA